MCERTGVMCGPRHGHGREIAEVLSIISISSGLNTRKKVGSCATESGPASGAGRLFERASKRLPRADTCEHFTPLDACAQAGQCLGLDVLDDLIDPVRALVLDMGAVLEHVGVGDERRGAILILALLLARAGARGQGAR